MKGVKDGKEQIKTRGNFLWFIFHLIFIFGHKVIVPKYRDFSSQEEHDNLILDKMSKLSKRDDLMILGDFLFDSDKYDYYIEQLSKMSCKIKLIMGNHDSMKLYKETRLPKLEIQLPLFSYKNMWVSHCPIHPQEIRNRLGCIHGHLHGDFVRTNRYIDIKDEYAKDSRYFNVNLDNNNFEFVSLDTIKEHFKGL